MIFVLIAVIVFLLGGVGSLAVGQRRAGLVAVAGVIAGSALAAAQAAIVLVRAEPQSIQLPWPVPLGSLSLTMDPLAAVFVLAISLVVSMAAIYGSAYLRAYAGRKRLAGTWFMFNLLAASMLVVVLAQNGVLFLVAWELMSLASFFLVMFEAEHESVRRAGWTYLVAMHLGTAFLIAMFLLLGRNAASLDFDQFAAAPGQSGLVFLLAIVGFGAKAGFIPMHVWLPEAHPAAPSHVSAVMSGVMIKTGIYGLLRTLTWLGPAPAWWGWTLVAFGATSGILGVLWALAQHDLKRLLAYHSVENIGIIALGMGVGLLGAAYGNPMMAALGFAGAMLHVVNHAVFKSLLFLGAGAALHATGTREIDRLGGLLKRMPVTGAAFVVGAAAISGLPPLSGFVSELLIYLGAVAGLSRPTAMATTGTALSVLVVGSLVLIGGLAAACFTKVFGVAFLGEPRSSEAAAAHEVGPAMRWPMIALAAACALIGLSAPLWPILLRPAVQSLVAPSAADEVAAALSQVVSPLTAVALIAGVLIGLVILLAQVRIKLLAGRRVEQSVTWDCGYVAPRPRMQYTASSFARPLVLFFRMFLRSKDEVDMPARLFPSHARLHTHAPDLFRQWVYEPMFQGIAWLASQCRWLQQGRIQLYVFYIAVTILVLLIWKL